MRAILFLTICATAFAQEKALGDRARQYLLELVKINTTNPPGSETMVAEYLKRQAEANGIASEVLGGDRSRLNFIARVPLAVRGVEPLKPLLLMAHSDVVPADPSQWTVDPFSAELRGGFIYGRGAQDDKSLLAAELAVLVE